jgi:hypothetical protein
MTNPQDPPRLLDSGEGSERLRELLRECTSDVASPNDVKRLETRLAPLIWAPLAPPAATGSEGAAASGSGSAASTTAATSSGVAVKAGAALVVAASLVGGGVWLSRSHDGSDHAARPAEAQSVSPAATVEEPATTVAPLPSDDDQTAPPSRDTAAERAQSTGKTREIAGESVSETDLLGQAQSLLRSNPARALELASEHRRKFPRGVLVQEREVLSIEALERLGRHKEAVARADGFLRSFPGSAHRSKVNAVVGRE